MAAPWEAYAAAPEGDGPWAQYAPAPERGVIDRLTGQTGERLQLWPERLARNLASSGASAFTLPHDVMTGQAHVPGSPDAQAIPGAVPFGSGSGERIADLATLGSPMAPRVLPGLATKAGLPTAEELKAAASSGYDAARGLGVDISSDSVSRSFQTLAQTLEKDGINSKLAPKTFGIISELSAPPTGSVATISNLETVRRSLGHAAQDFLNPTEKMAASRAIKHLDDYLGNIPASDVLAGDAAQASKILSEARGNYAAGKRSAQINGEVDIAEGNAAAANSGQNLGNSTRQRFNSILKSDKKSSGYTDAEIAQMERVRDGTLTGNVTRLAGNLLGGGGGLGSVASAAVGAGALGPAGAAAPAFGYLLKKISDASVNRQVRLLDEMTRARSPLAEASASFATPDPIKQQLLLRAFLASEAQRNR